MGLIPSCGYDCTILWQHFKKTLGEKLNGKYLRMLRSVFNNFVSRSCDPQEQLCDHMSLISEEIKVRQKMLGSERKQGRICERFFGVNSQIKVYLSWLTRKGLN